MDIESGHEEVYKPLTTKKHAPPESRASRRYAIFLTATKVLCLLMVLSLLGYYVYVTVTMDDATAQLVRDVSKLKQHNHQQQQQQQHRNSSNEDNVPAWFEHLLKLTRKGFVHISLQPFPPEPRRPTITPSTTTTTTTTTVEPPTTSSTTSTTTTSTTSTTENTPEEDSTTESTTTTETANDIELDYGSSL